MKSDYQILFEVLKEKTEFLERSWKSALIHLKESTQAALKANSSLNELFSATEMGRSSLGRRINPTLLKSDPKHIGNVSADSNPFLSAPMADEPNSREFPLNRPVGKYAQESAWKKLPTAPAAKVSEQLNLDFGSAKMEYAVYFKQGISYSQQEMIKKLASAYYQIVFDEVIVDFSSFTESFGIILRILSIGHELFSLNTFSKLVTEEFLLRNLPKASYFNESSIFETPIEMFLFSVCWIQISRDGLIQLLPDSLKCFEKNSFLETIDPSMVQFFKSNFRKEESPLNTFSSGNGSGVSLHSLLPVAYSNQRDSKNFSRDPNAHANQQKVRDLFINLIRHFTTNQLDTSHPNFHRSFTARVSELMTKVNSDNYAWLADLYIQEYEQAADVRLDRLEERMSSRRSSTANTSTTFSLDQIFFMFLQYADSFRLTKAIEKKTILVISVSLEQANNPHKRALWSECIRKLRSIIKLLAFCRYKLSELLCLNDGKNDNNVVMVEEEDVIIYSWTQDAILNRQLLTLLPLICEYFTFIGSDAIKSRCSNTVKLLMRYYQVKFEMKRKRTKGPSRAKLLLKLCLEDIFRETLQPDFYAECAVSMGVLHEEESVTEEDDEKRISKSRKEGDGVLARPIDEDEVLPHSVSSVYRSISSQIRGIYLQLNSICLTVGLNSSATDPPHRNNPDSSPLADSTLRKVRPVTQVPAADLKQQKIQKQLRQWFWWRYGSQKDLIDALNSYILEQLLFPQFPMPGDRLKSAEICRQMYREMIYKVLPELLPNFWKEQPELVEMILNLSLEVAGKIIKHHFS